MVFPTKAYIHQHRQSCELTRAPQIFTRCDGETGHLFVGILHFCEAFFEEASGLRPVAQVVFDKCKDGTARSTRRKAPGRAGLAWRGQKQVLSWLAPRTGLLWARGMEIARRSTVLKLAYT
jgi:hypothetical protein